MARQAPAVQDAKHVKHQPRPPVALVHALQATERAVLDEAAAHALERHVEAVAQVIGLARHARRVGSGVKRAVSVRRHRAIVNRKRAVVAHDALHKALRGVGAHDVARARTEDAAVHRTHKHGGREEAPQVPHDALKGQVDGPRLENRVAEVAVFDTQVRL
ncbi:MAG: hypothetical protein CL844_03860 [Crocinitomicaceae bacterium]|nr:hypothetical protein [Crocinitomicaceae bacterium]